MTAEIERWKQAFIEKFGDFDLLEISYERDKIETLAGELFAVPFMAEKRLILIKDLLKNCPGDNQQEIKKLLEVVPDSTVVLMAESAEPDKRTSLFKYLSTESNVRLFLKPKGAQLISWVIRRSEINSANIDPEAARYLIGIAGDNLWQLENEIQKLALYSRGQKISTELVDELTCGGAQESIFKMVEALSRKDMPEFLKTMKNLEDQGVETGFIFAMIARQFRLLLEIKTLSENRMTASMIASKIGAHPFVVNNTLRYAKNFNYGQLKSILKNLLELDRRIKSGKIGKDYLYALEWMMMEGI